MGRRAPRSSILCDPAIKVSVNGVLPRRTPSTKASAPDGLVVTTTVPVVIGDGASTRNRFAASNAPPATSTRSITAAATLTNAAAVAAGRVGGTSAETRPRCDVRRPARAGS